MTKDNKITLKSFLRWDRDLWLICQNSVSSTFFKRQGESLTRRSHLSVLLIPILPHPPNPLLSSHLHCPLCHNPSVELSKHCRHSALINLSSVKAKALVTFPMKPDTVGKGWGGGATAGWAY